MFSLGSNICINETFPIVVEHLISLEEKLSSYIPSLNPEEYDWITNPFMETSSNIVLTFIEEELAAI